MKPYDLEQAKKDVLDEAKRSIEFNAENIQRTAENAIKRLATEIAAGHDPRGSTFAEMVRSASFFLAEDFDLRYAHPEAKKLAIASSGFRFFVQGHGDVGAGSRGYHDAEIPNVKHRILIFFLPVEE